MGWWQAYLSVDGLETVGPEREGWSTWLCLRDLLEALEKEEDTHTRYAGLLVSVAPAREGAGAQQV